MGILKKLGKSGMFGLAGLAATNPKVTNKIARSGGLGLAGMALAKKKKAAEAAGGMRGRPMVEDVMVAEQAPMGMRGRPMMDEVMMAEEAPAGAMMRKGGKVSAAQAVHKHERAKHKGQPLTKMAKGGSASRRGDGIATKGKTKGRFV
jgi:general stress protein YciG